MKKFFGLVGTLIVVVLAALYINHLRQRSAVDRRGNLQDELIAAAEQIRPTLPRRIDGATLIGISTADTSLTYQYKLDIKNSQLPANAVDALNKAAVQQVCKSTQMVELMSMGATYINSYVDADSRWVAQFTVRNRDCET